MRRLEKTELLHAVAAWTHSVGAGTDLRLTLPPALEWLRRQWEGGNDHLPLDLVHDLGQLLLLGRDFRFASDRFGSRWTEEERRWRLDYEDRVLGQWALDQTVMEAHVVIAGMNDELRQEAVCHAIGLALARRSVELDLVFGNPAFLRSERERIDAFLLELPEQAEAWREIVDPAWIEWVLAQRRAALTARRTQLFSEEDLWELAHIEHLPNESTRLALRQIHEAASRVGPVASTTALQLGRRAKEIPVEEEAAEQYPAGGFEALSTKGRFENLVRSEIAYVGEGTVSGVDLFDVRFAQGELLFYTRDESPMLDARTELTVVIDRAHQMRHKHPALPAQTLVLVEGLALRLQSDLVAILGPAGAVLSLEWLALPADLEVITEERRSLSLTLADEIAHHRARLGLPSSWSEAGTRRRIVFSPGPNVSRIESWAWVRVGDPVWLLEDHAFDVSDPAGMRDLADLLLSRVLQPNRPT